MRAGLRRLYSGPLDRFCGETCGLIRSRVCSLYVEDRIVSTDAVHGVSHGPQQGSGEKAGPTEGKQR